MPSETSEVDLSSLRINRDKNDDPKPSGSRVIWIVGAMILLIIIIAWFLFRGFMAPAIKVQTAPVMMTSPSQMSAVLNASGYVVAQQKASVASKGTGRLEYLGVEEGDRVKRGQILARLEDKDVIAVLEQARADLEVTRADRDESRSNLDRMNALYASQLVSKAELDVAEARYKRVEAMIQSAAAAVRGAEVALENTRIRAPFDGTVLTKDADVGEVVAPFASSANSRGAVVTIADMTSLEVEADVSESNITRVSAGQPCEIVLDAYPDKRYQGYVHKIVPTADRAKATVLTKVRFQERDDRVLPEMSAKVSFLSMESGREPVDNRPRMTVASSSVITRNGRNIVLIVREGSIVEVPVVTGMTIGTRTEITEGLTIKDQVVTQPSGDLTAGTPVEITN